MPARMNKICWLMGHKWVYTGNAGDDAEYCGRCGIDVQALDAYEGLSGGLHLSHVGSYLLTITYYRLRRFFFVRCNYCGKPESILFWKIGNHDHIPF